MPSSERLSLDGCAHSKDKAQLFHRKMQAERPSATPVSGQNWAQTPLFLLQLLFLIKSPNFHWGVSYAIPRRGGIPETDLEDRTLDKGMTHPLLETCPTFSSLKENLGSMFRYLTIRACWYLSSREEGTRPLTFHLEVSTSKCWKT